MIRLIKKGAKLSEENRPLIWSEIALFATVTGLLFHSWLVFIVISGALIWLMTRTNGMFYMIFAISSIWAIIPFCAGFAGGGLLWALIAGGVAFWMGIKVHVNGLKWYWDEVICRNDDVIEWRRMGWYGSNASKQPSEKFRFRQY